MAYIKKKPKKDGSISYLAEITIKRHGEVVHRESRSFAKQSLAKAWAAKREIELQEKEVFAGKQKLIISDLINEYLDRFKAGRSKRYDLIRLTESDLAKKNIYRLTSADIINHCAERNKTAKPQTVKNDVIWLKAVLTTMKGVHSYDYSLDMFDAANAVMRKEGITARPDQRKRRPTRKELWLLSRHFYHRKTPYLHLMWFAIFSARRLSEICKIRWDDINHDNKTILVRDMKTPGKKALNLRGKLPRSAYRIIMRQKKKDDRIFPYDPKTISTGFTRACHALAIEDLHFHDLRREACSRLAESGLSVDEIAMISLHQDWSSLKIYHKPDPGLLDV
jgi:integrase